MVIQLAREIVDPKNARAYGLIEDLIDTEVLGTRPFLVGITGPGGAGKSTLARNLVSFFGRDITTVMTSDDYFLPRAIRQRLGLTGESPSANRFGVARLNLETLKEGRPILKPVYDHSNGTLGDPEDVDPTPVMIVEGVSALHERVFDVYDRTIFLDASEEIQIRSKVERDVQERGYTRKQAMKLFRAIQPEYRAHVEPRRAFANVVFSMDENYVMTDITSTIS